MSMIEKRESRLLAVGLILVSVSLMIFAVSNFIGASEWWRIFTSLLVAALAITLFVVNVRRLFEKRPTPGVDTDHDPYLAE